MTIATCHVTIATRHLTIRHKTHHLTVVTYQVVIEARLMIIDTGDDVVRTDLVHLTNLTEHSVSNEFISYSAMFL